MAPVPPRHKVQGLPITMSHFAGDTDTTVKEELLRVQKMCLDSGRFADAHVAETCLSSMKQAAESRKLEVSSLPCCLPCPGVQIM